MTDSPKHVTSSPPNEPTNLDTIIASTNSVSSRLKTLEQEHLILLSDLPEDVTLNEETANDFECLLAQEKRQVLTESMKKLHTGLNEAKVRNGVFYVTVCLVDCGTSNKLCVVSGCIHC